MSMPAHARSNHASHVRVSRSSPQTTSPSGPYTAMRSQLSIRGRVRHAGAGGESKEATHGRPLKATPAPAGASAPYDGLDASTVGTTDHIGTQSSSERSPFRRQRRPLAAG